MTVTGQKIEKFVKIFENILMNQLPECINIWNKASQDEDIQIHNNIFKCSPWDPNRTCPREI